MSLKSIFQKINPSKLLGYGVAASASIPAAMDVFRMASGDMSASASFAQNFSIVAAGFGIAQSNNQLKATAEKPKLIMPQRVLIAA